MAATTAQLVNEFIELDLARKAKEDEVEKQKERLAELQAELLTRFENAGMQSMRSKEFGVTIYVRREIWASPAEGNETLLMERLKSLGLGDMVKEKVNTQTLSAYVRELEETQLARQGSADEVLKILPEPLQSTIKLSERFSLRTKKG